MVEWSDGQMVLMAVMLLILAVGIGATAYYCGKIQGYLDRQDHEAAIKKRIEEWRKMGME